MLASRLGIHYNKYKLITDDVERSIIFKSMNIYIPFFLHHIWDNPESIVTILLEADRNDVKNNLARFVTNYLYENVVSSNGQEDQLLYIITLLLKEEINNLDDDDINLLKFLNNTPCGYILEELLDKKEVKLFFKNIIKNMMKNIEMMYSTNDIIFDPNKISDIIIKRKNLNNGKEINKQLKKQFKIVEDKYFFSLSLKEMKEKCLENENPEVENYLKDKIDKCQLDPLLYSFENIINMITDMENFDEIYKYYKESYAKITYIIDILLETLLKNSNLLPYNIKCICKIISFYIKKKFPQKSKIEQNAYLGNFFFGKLLFLVFENPALYILMNEHLVIGKTKEILGIVEMVLTKFITGSFFEKTEFVVGLNNYFIEKIPTLIKIFDNICQVTLPPFLDKLINDKLPENYKYNYFQENPEENIFYRHICFNAEILYSLIINANKCKDKILLDNRLIDRLNYNIKILEDLKNNIETNEQNFRKINYFLLSDTINKAKYEKILNIKREKDYFTLKELKKIETDEQQIQNNLIKVKNFFFSFLYNNPTLNINDYNKDNLNDIISILKEIKNISNTNPYIYYEQNSKTNTFLDKLLGYIPILEKRNKSNNISLDNTVNELVKNLKSIKSIIKNQTNQSFQKPIPIKWFLGSLIEYLPKLPEEYIKNNYEKLLNELEEDINNSIKELDFEFLGNTVDHIREIEKNKSYYQNVKNILIDIDLNKKIDSIVEKEQIPVNIIYNNDDENIELSIQTHAKKRLSTSFSFFQKKKDDENNIRYCPTIKSFIQQFPDLTKYELLQDANLIELIQKIKLPSKLGVYFKMIKEHIQEKKLVDQNNFENIYYKIYDYIMEQLNEKIFPIEEDEKDNIILKNYTTLGWIKPYHLFDFRKDYIFDYFLPDAITYFQRIDEEKSPRKKLLCIKEIFNCLFNLGKFNNDEVEGADEEMNLLNYTFIKAKAQNIYTNCQYTALFLEDKKGKLEDNLLTKIISLCDKIAEFSFKDLINISESDYEENCKLAHNEVVES